MSRAARLLSSLIPVVSLAACFEAPDLGGDQLEGKVFPGDDCPEWGCTGNSPTMGPYGFHELNLDGRPNAADVSIDSIHLAGGAPVRVHFVKGHQLVAVDAANTEYTGVQLNGLVFRLRTPTGSYLLTVKTVTPQAVSPTKMWVGDDDRVETNELVVADINTPTRTQAMCGNPPGHELNPQGLPAWPNTIEAILFQGDRYDAEKKLVTAASDQDAGAWFNIGCAGSALAKLYLTRHATATSDPTHQTTLEQRQALLKMYSGDFCGEGLAYTQPNTALHLESNTGWVAFDGLETGFESFWDEKGALCLTQHRIDADYLQSVNDNCALPACPGSPFPSAWMPGAYLKTAIPN